MDVFEREGAIAAFGGVRAHPQGAHSQAGDVEPALASLRQPHALLVERQRLVKWQLAFLERGDDGVEFLELLFKWACII